jgi:hypothetical protein
MRNLLAGLDGIGIAQWLDYRLLSSSVWVIAHIRNADDPGGSRKWQ